jgi:hypothetical protein
MGDLNGRSIGPDENSMTYREVKKKVALQRAVFRGRLSGRND